MPSYSGSGRRRTWTRSTRISTILVVGYEAFGLTYNYLVDSGPNLEPVAGFAESWERAADGHSWTFHIRDGMKWSDGEPATAEDACFSWQLGVDAIAADESLGAGYLEPTMSDAGVTKVECPDANTLIATTDDPSDRVLQIAIPIIPKHIWGKETYKTIGKAKFDAPLVGTGPYTVVEWQTGQFIRLQRNPNYWGKQGFADEVDIVIYKTADTMVQALKDGDLDYAHGVECRAAQPAQDRAEHRDRGRQRQRLDPARLQRLRGRHRQDDPGRRPVDQGPARPGVPRRARLRRRPQALVDRVLGGYGDVGTTIVPPVLTSWHVEPTTQRTFDIELAKQKLDAAGYVLEADGRRLDKEGKPITLRMFMPDSDDNYPKAAQFIADWYGQLGIEGHDPGPELGRPRREDPAAGRPARATPPTTTSSCGAGPAASIPNGLLHDLRVRRRSAARRTASTAIPATTRCTRTS